MNTRRIGVISNMHAAKSGKYAARVLDFVRSRPELLSVEPSSAEEVGDALRELADQGIDTLVINGGDGTVQRILTELFTTRPFEQVPALVPLRVGRTNTSAFEIGAHRDPVASLARLLEHGAERARSEHGVERFVLRIEIEPDGRVEYGMFCGLGVIYRAIHYTHAIFPDGRAQGAFGSGFAVVSLLSRLALGRSHPVLEPDPVSIGFDGAAPKSNDYQVALATTQERLFLNLKPFWGREAAPIKVTTIVSGSGLKLSYAWRILRGHAPDPRGDVPGFFSGNVDSVVMKLDCGFTIDGEMFDAAAGRVLTIDGDRKVSFLSP